MRSNDTLGATGRPRAHARPLAPSRRLLSAVAAWLREVGRRHRDQRALSAMTNRELEDIGLSRTDCVKSLHRRTGKR